MRGLALLLCLAALACAGRAGAAHEWRAAWGAPHPLAPLALGLLREGDSLRAAVGVARPFGVAGLSFTSAVLCGGMRGWEIHAGALQGPLYQEAHAGLGRRVRLAEGQSALLGLRLFMIRAGEVVVPARAGLTALIDAHPPGMRSLSLEAGLVDLPLTGRRDGPAPLLLSRLVLAARGRRFCVEYALAAAGTGETTLAALLPIGPLRFLQLLRAGTGEGSSMLLLRAGSWEVGLGEAWHPQLGWTPSVSLLRRSGS